MVYLFRYKPALRLHSLEQADAQESQAEMQVGGLSSKGNLQIAHRMPPSIDEAIASLGQELRCGVCLSMFTTPSSLPCCHVFCEECLSRAITERQKCPVCNKSGRRRDVCKHEIVGALVAKFQHLMAKIKEEYPDTAVASQVNQEDAQASAVLQHPNIVPGTVRAPLDLREGSEDLKKIQALQGLPRRAGQRVSGAPARSSGRSTASAVREGRVSGGTNSRPHADADASELPGSQQREGEQQVLHPEPAQPAGAHQGAQHNEAAAAAHEEEQGLSNGSAGKAAMTSKKRGLIGSTSRRVSARKSLPSPAAEGGHAAEAGDAEGEPLPHAAAAAAAAAAQGNPEVGEAGAGAAGTAEASNLPAAAGAAEGATTAGGQGKPARPAKSKGLFSAQRKQQATQRGQPQPPLVTPTVSEQIGIVQAQQWHQEQEQIPEECVVPGTPVEGPTPPESTGGGAGGAAVLLRGSSHVGVTPGEGSQPAGHQGQQQQDPQQPGDEHHVTPAPGKHAQQQQQQQPHNAGDSRHSAQAGPDTGGALPAGASTSGGAGSRGRHPPGTTGGGTSAAAGGGGGDAAGGSQSAGRLEVGMDTGAARRVATRLLPWECTRCTLHNKSSARRCAACKNPRAASAAVVTPDGAGASGGIKKEEAGEAGGRGGEDPGQQGPGQVPGHETSEPVLGSKRAIVHDGSPVPKCKLEGGSGKGRKKQPLLPPVPPKPRTADTAADHPAGAEDAAGTQAGGSGKGAKAGGRAPKRQRGKAAISTPAPANDDGDADGENGHRKPAAPTSSVTTGAGAGAGTRGGEASTALAPWGKGHKGQRPGWVLLGSGLDDAGKVLLKQLATVSGTRLVSSWSSSVTHVVCSVDAQGKARRTYKYLLGITQGCWIVSLGWAQACLAAGQPVGEGEHEVTLDNAGGQCGPAAGRQRVAESRPLLLTGVAVLLVGPFGSREDVTQLLQAAGATLLTRPRATSTAGGGRSSQQEQQHGAGQTLQGASVLETGVALYDAEACGSKGSDPASAGAAAVRAGMPLVSHKWMLDCVGAQTLLPFEPLR